MNNLSILPPHTGGVKHVRDYLVDNTIFPFNCYYVPGKAEWLLGKCKCDAEKTSLNVPKTMYLFLYRWQ